MTHQSATLRQVQAKANLSASQEALPLHIPLTKELKEQRKHISKKHTKRRVGMKPSETANRRQRWCVCLSLKEVRGVGWELVEGEGCIVNQAALPKVGTCKSGERRAGTRPNDSSTALYKYSHAGSARLLLPVSKKP